ncbi:MAG TPA: hypothetical protein VJQ54_09985 [Candidatus Sulfotelmatobacter sp.]|nr:hypothetical protein [Candidatus Sulfotelmatobacter sp.]
MPTAVPILVTSLDGKHFSEVCETLVVNAHGCSMVTPVKLDNGIPLRFHSKEGRETMAHVVSCQPMGPDNASWMLGARLEKPENFWGLSNCPKDWGTQLTSPALSLINAKTSAKATDGAAQTRVSPEISTEVLLRRLEQPMKEMVSAAVRPLQAEVAALVERLRQRESNRSRFEVSLSAIPPELEQQLEARLQTNLGPRILEDARKQYKDLLSAANTTIERKTAESSEDFLRRVTDQLKVVEKQSQALSSSLTRNVEEGVRRNLEDFRNKVMEGGNSLKRLSEEMLQYMQQTLNEEQDARREEVEKIRMSIAAECSRLREHVESLENRIGKLDQAARALESGLDQRLSVLSSNTIKETRGQLQGVASEILSEWAACADDTLTRRLGEASEKMKVVEKEIVAAGSQSLNAEAAHALRSFENSMQDLARLSSTQWRSKLEGALQSLLKTVGEQFEADAKSAGDTRN